MGWCARFSLTDLTHGIYSLQLPKNNAPDEPFLPGGPPPTAQQTDLESEKDWLKPKISISLCLCVGFVVGSQLI